MQSQPHLLLLLLLYKHICTNHILGKEQFRFKINSFTEAASYTVTNEILQVMNNRLFVGGKFCDLEKAFDCVNHGILVDKLQLYGISGKFLPLIQSNLTGRYQKYSLIKLMYTIDFLLDGKIYKWGSSGFDFGSTTFSYLYL